MIIGAWQWHVGGCTALLSAGEHGSADTRMREDGTVDSLAGGDAMLMNYIQCNAQNATRVVGEAA